jgi:hypothetical protein
MKAITRMLIVMLLITLAMSCEDDSQAIEYRTQGFIKGKITGVSGDGLYTFDNTFNYTQYSHQTLGLSLYEIYDDGSCDGGLSRMNFKSSGSASVYFALDNVDDPTPNILNVSVWYSKELSDRVITFSMSSDEENITTITDFSFDPETGRVKGKFTLTGSYNTTSNNAVVTGEFDGITKLHVQ